MNLREGGLLPLYLYGIIRVCSDVGVLKSPRALRSEALDNVVPIAKVEELRNQGTGWSPRSWWSAQDPVGVLNHQVGRNLVCYHRHSPPEVYPLLSERIPVPE
ncbi:hypothetical protein NDU88_006036 [Pleurodeles waltl]|uniref:Uncharacterized protein n=1 Tax=Pleurodeles waltl TaxID=8319 RepID=A0AAV7LMV5_PLEWA|nr:hypothetical protein NDU88_006036 [Pleurodeles waltl]